MRLNELFEAKKDATAAHELINTHGDADMDHGEIVELLVGNGFDRELAVTIASDYRPLDEGFKEDYNHDDLERIATAAYHWSPELQRKFDLEEVAEIVYEYYKNNPDEDFKKLKVRDVANIVLTGKR